MFFKNKINFFCCFCIFMQFNSIKCQSADFFILIPFIMHMDCACTVHFHAQSVCMYSSRDTHSQNRTFRAAHKCLCCIYTKRHQRQAFSHRWCHFKKTIRNQIYRRSMPSDPRLPHAPASWYHGRARLRIRLSQNRSRR